MSNLLYGKDSYCDRNWPKHIEHPKPGLFTCSIAMYDKCNLPAECGQGIRLLRNTT